MGTRPPAGPGGQGEREEVFEVMIGNWDSVIAFLDCGTQWRLAVGMGGAVWLGLDYAGVDVVLRHMDLADAGAVFADLRVMERAALAVFAEDAR